MPAFLIFKGNLFQNLGVTVADVKDLSPKVFFNLPLSSSRSMQAFDRRLYLHIFPTLIKLLKYSGAAPWIALNVIMSTLKRMRYLFIYVILFATQ